MASLNKVMLIGNLTKKPEIRYTPKGTAVADLGLAVNRTFTQGEAGDRTEEVTFIDVVLWGRTAEIAEKYLDKGRPIFIEGRLQLDQWVDKQTGQNRSKLRVVGERMEFLGGPREAGGGSSSNYSSHSDGGGGGGGGGGEGGGDEEPGRVAEPRRRPQPVEDARAEEDDDIPF